MRLLTSLVALAFAAPALATLPPPDSFDRSYYLQAENNGLGPERGTLFDTWEADMRPLVRKQGEAKAAAQLASRYGLSQPQMRELLALWLYSAWNFSERVPDAQASEVFTRYDALLAQTKRAPLVLQAKAVSLGLLDRCTRPMLDATMVGAANPAEDSWQIAQATPECPAAQALLARHDPARALPSLYETLNSKWLDPAERIAVLEFLLSPAAMDHLAAEQRHTATLRMTRILIGDLLGEGLRNAAIARFEALPREDREAILKAAIGSNKVLIDGRPARLTTIYDFDNSDQDESVASGTASLQGVKPPPNAPSAGTRSDNKPRPTFDAEIITALSAAYLLNGNQAAAREVFGHYDLAAARSWIACMQASGMGERGCGPQPTSVELAVELDHLLNSPGADPYPLAELFMSGQMGLTGGAPRFRTFSMGALIDCQVYAEPRYATLCGKDKPLEAPYRDHDWDQVHPPAIELAKALIPGFADRAKAVAGSFPGAGLPLTSQVAGFDRLPPREPDPLPWSAEPIPAAQLGQGKAQSWPRGWRPIPDGFQPVRFVNEGGQIAVISLSQRYDPAGEVSPGGYWLHVSVDGGKSWKSPLYTGLVHRFPYVVVPNPRLPLFDGDALTLAVNEELLDTRSITYPPVGLQTLRKRAGLLLRIPLEDLTRDSNADGISDIAARHLLLEGSSARSVRLGKPDPAACSGEAALRASATAAVLGRLTGRDSGALFEPVDRDQSKPLSIDVQILDVSRGRGPLLIEGDPADYACLATNTEVIVFPPAAIAAMAGKSPDFRAISIERAIVNRAGTRGYVIWSAGWTGGTLGLSRNPDGSWKIHDISSWIT